MLNESIQQLDEFAMLRNVKSKLKNVSSKVVSAAKRVYDAIMKRISQAFSFIKTLGVKMLQGLLNFLGVSVDRVSVSGGGRFPLR